MPRNPAAQATAHEVGRVVRALRSWLPWAALGLVLVLALLAYQVPYNFDVAMGSPAAAPYITNFYPRQLAEGRPARWSHAYSYVRLPGTGGNRPLRITVDFNPSRSGVQNPPPVAVAILVGGEEIYSRAVRPNSGWQQAVLDVDSSHPAALAARDLAIEIRTDVYRPPDYQGNEAGLLVSGVKVEPLPGTGWQPVVPNLTVMMLLGLLVLGIYLLVVRAWGSGDERRAGVWGGGVAAAAGLALVGGIAFGPVQVAMALPDLVWAVIVGYLLLLAALYVLPPLARPVGEEWREFVAATNYWPLLALAVAGALLFTIAYQFPANYTIDVGSGKDEPFLRDFNPPMYPLPDGSPGNYRFTSARSEIVLPGVGSGNVYRVALKVNTGSGPASKGDVRLLAGGEDVWRGRLKPGWQTLTATVNAGPAALFGAADLRLEIRSPAEIVEGGEQRGIMVDTVDVTQAGRYGLLSLSPIYMAGLLLAVLLVYLLVVRSGGLAVSRQARRLGILSGAATLVALAWALAAKRVDVAVALPVVLVALVAGYLLLVIVGRLLTRVYSARPVWATRALAATFAVAFVLRFGVAALPQMTVIDLPYHLKWLKTLIGGNFLALYLPGQLSQVPPEWNLDVLIPKSPLFYMAVWPLGLWPGLDLGPAVLFVVSLLDALVVVGVFALAVRVSVRGAVWAAILYAVMPLAFRSFIYGILPTIFAQALTLAVVLVPVLGPQTLRRPVVFVGWLLLLTASLIAFPTALAFNSLVLVILAVGWVWRRAATRGTLTVLLGGLAGALVLSLVLYYGLYAGPLVTRTLPALLGGSGLKGQALWPGGPLELVSWTAGYLVNWWPLLMLPIALAYTWPRTGGYARRLSVLLLAWLVVLVLGMALNLRFDMIGKHLYYTMPAAAIAGGLVLGWLRAHPAGRPWQLALALLTGTSVAWYALAFVASRIPG